MIIDAHAHLGSCRVFDLDISEELLLHTMEVTGVDAIIVQPFPGAPDAAAVHDWIAGLAKRYPSRTFGLASLNPHMDEEAYQREIERCVRELGFVGVKIHTVGHAVNPLGRHADLVARTARDLGVAVMIHTGPGVPFALPSMAIPLAQRYPDVRFVLAHAGYAVFTAEAQIAAQLCPNIYLEPSWCTPGGILGLIRSLGPDRVLFGSDMPINQAPQLATLRLLGLTDDELDTCLWRTAARVFDLPLGA
jgi:predicted TIM-barrel fold metal-dependent hydrolase